MDYKGSTEEKKARLFLANLGIATSERAENGHISLANESAFQNAFFSKPLTDFAVGYQNQDYHVSVEDANATTKNVAVLFYVYDLVSNRTEMVVPLFSSLSTAILP